MAATSVIKNVACVGAIAGAALVMYLCMDSLRHKDGLEDKPFQRLICSTGVGVPGAILGEGYIYRYGEGTYRIDRPGEHTQYVDKGAMDVCVIANIPRGTSA